MASAGIRVGWGRVGLVMGTPVATGVATSDAKPHTNAGVADRIGNFEACTIGALPPPTSTAAVIGPGGPPEMASSDSVAMAIPVKLLARDWTRPRRPPPTMKKDAQAMNVTNTGTGMMV